MRPIRSESAPTTTPPSMPASAPQKPSQPPCASASFAGSTDAMFGPIIEPHALMKPINTPYESESAQNVGLAASIAAPRRVGTRATVDERDGGARRGGTASAPSRRRPDATLSASMYLSLIHI